MKAGHTYYVRLNNEPARPRIQKVFREGAEARRYGAEVRAEVGPLAWAAGCRPSTSAPASHLTGSQIELAHLFNGGGCCSHSNVRLDLNDF